MSRTTFSGPVVSQNGFSPTVYTSATLPAASSVPSGTILTVDDGSGPTLVISNATVWSAVSGAGNYPKPSIGYPLASGLDANSGCSAVSATLSYIASTLPNGVKANGARVTSNGGATTACTVDVPFSVTSTFATQRCSFLVYIPPATAALNLSMTVYIADAGFTSWFQVSIPANRHGWQTICPTQSTASKTSQLKWAVGGGTPAFGSTNFAKARLRLDYTAGMAPVFDVFAITDEGGIYPAPIVISPDDGLASQYTLLLPMLEKYGLKASFGIIGDLLNTGGYMTDAQVQDLFARGHEMNPHGPVGGTGSLLNYNSIPDLTARAAARTADIQTHIRKLQGLGVIANNSERIYIWPQGADQEAAGDDTIRQAAAAAGIRGARGTIPTRDDHFGPFGPTYLAQYLSVVGHSWANKSDGSQGVDSDEAANIAAIQQRIVDNVAARRPSVLMLHEIVSAATTPTVTTQIRQNNVEAIFQTIAAQIKTGNAVNMTHTGLYRAITGALPS